MFAAALEDEGLRAALRPGNVHRAREEGAGEGVLHRVAEELGRVGRERDGELVGIVRNDHLAVGTDTAVPVGTAVVTARVVVAAAAAAASSRDTGEESQTKDDRRRPSEHRHELYTAIANSPMWSDIKKAWAQSFRTG